jgi:DNA-binding MarR family transcriptional regulator
MSTAPSREELMAALQAALRETSGQGVLFSHAAAERLGVNSTDLDCMGYLVDGPMTAGALAQATGLTTGAITGVIDRLERAGYAARERDPHDRRKVLARLTPLAAERARPVFAPMEQAVAQVLAAYDDAQLAFLLNFLHRLREMNLATLS